MTLRTQRWSPDTCDCKLDMQYDDNIGMDGNSTILDSSTICAQHTGKTKLNILASAYLDHNVRKNKLMGHITDNFTAQLTKLGISGSPIPDDSKFTLSWSGTGDNRVLTITIASGILTTQQKSTLQTAVNTLFGTGKVVVQ